MNGARTPKDDIADIIGQVAADELGRDSFSADDLKSLADRLDLLTADFGRWESYKAASAEYVEAFKVEIDWHRKIRLAVAVVSLILILFLGACLTYGILNAETLFKGSGSHSLTALIVSCVTGCVVVTIAVVKGAFSNVADRNAGLPMPDHMKEIVDAGKSIIGSKFS